MSVHYRPVSRSISKLITFEHIWTIESIDQLNSDEIVGHSAVWSPIFTAPPDKITTEDKKPVEFQLEFYPKGCRENQDFVGVFLHLNNHPGLDIKYIFSVAMANGEKRYVSVSRFDLPSHMSWGTKRTISRDELYDPANGFLTNGSLTLHCEVKIITSEPEADLCDQLQAKYSQPDMLAKSFADLLESGAHSNVTLVLVDDGDMFESRMAECETNRVEIAETRVEVFKQVLHFIYTGKVASLDGIVKDLLVCADKYQLDPLKSICDEYLSACITPESDLSDLLALATLHDAPKLMAKVVGSMRKDIEAELLDVDKLVQIKAMLSSLAIDKKD